MKTVTKTLIAAIGVLTMSTAIATAEVVCNEDGDCWRVKERAEYKPEFRLKVYPDNWKWEEREKDKYRWKESGSAKRGYWRQGVWLEIGD